MEMKRFVLFTQARAVTSGDNLVTIGQGVGHVEQADNSHDLAECFLVHSLLAQSGGVRVDAIRTTVGRRDSQCDDLTGLGI